MMPGRRSSAALALALILAGPAAAQDATPKPGPEVARGTGALLRGLDKVSGQTIDLPVRAGEAATLGRLQIRLGECRYPAGDPSSDAWAELTITDTGRGATVFAGWMIASLPAISALDDARYDVWVISCSST